MSVEVDAGADAAAAASAKKELDALTPAALATALDLPAGSVMSIKGAESEVEFVAPPSVATVVLTLTASGSVSDYTDSDKSSWQQKVANAAGVDQSLVTILVAAASVRITATIAVPASTTADAVQTSLSSSFGTAADASTALGVTVEEVPTITFESPPSSPPTPLVASTSTAEEPTTDPALDQQTADEGVGAGADRMAYGGQPVADMPDALSHLSNALDRRAATEGTEFVELKLLADGQPVIMDSPIYLKYQDLYHLDLWEAAKTGDLARLKELLDEGHAIDERQDGATPMYWAQYYLQPEAMEFLLERGADPNAKELVLP